MIDARIRIYQDGWWMIDGGLRSKKHQTTGNISKIYSSISHTWYIGISWEYHPQFTFRYGMVTTSFSTIHLGGLGKASAPSKWLSRSKKKATLFAWPWRRKTRFFFFYMAYSKNTSEYRISDWPTTRHLNCSPWKGEEKVTSLACG